jgi:hypothetical protein
LVLRVARPGADRPPAVLGETRAAPQLLAFEPRFSLQAGLDYLASAELPDGTILERALRLSAEPLEPTTFVERVSPATDVVPANLLKLYVHFSAPMTRGEAYRHVRLVDPSGRELPDVLLEVEPELWDPDGARLTLLFDPGRIKRGLRLRRELGPTLEPGRVYTLAIDAGWPDARGAPLRAGHRKTFRTVESDDLPPDPRSWELVRPGAGTREALGLRFGEPLDRALLERMLTVWRGGRALEGEVRLSDDELAWSFVPSRPWMAGPHQVRVDPLLEDLAGNGVGRPFEVDLRPPARDPGAPDPDGPVRIVFEPAFDF